MCIAHLQSLLYCTTSFLLYLTNGSILKPVINLLAGSNGKSKIVIKNKLFWLTQVTEKKNID